MSRIIDYIKEPVNCSPLVGIAIGILLCAQVYAFPTNNKSDDLTFLLLGGFFALFGAVCLATSLKENMQMQNAVISAVFLAWGIFELFGADRSDSIVPLMVGAFLLYKAITNNSHPPFNPKRPRY